MDGLRSFKAFDIFVRKGKIKKYKKEFDWLYKVDCVFAKVFEDVFKDYKWIGSEDDLHSYPINLKIPKSFEVIYLDKYYPLSREKAMPMIRKDLEIIKNEIASLKNG